MKTIQDSIESREKIIECLSTGKVVIIPSNSVYTINTNLFNEEAIKKLYLMKEKDKIEPMSVYVYNWAMARVLTELNEIETKIVETITNKFWPGPLTIIISSNSSYISPYYILNGTISLECPDHDIPRYILEYNEMPLLTASANRENSIHSICGEHVNKYFSSADDVTFINTHDPPKYGIKNSIIKIKDNAITFIRNGIITMNDIQTECDLNELDVNIHSELSKQPPYENSKTSVLGQFIQGSAIDIDIATNHLGKSIELYFNNSIFIDFGGRNLCFKDLYAGYVDLSEKDNIKEALFNINNVFHQLEDIRCKNVIFFNFYKSKEGAFKTLYDIILRYCRDKELFIPIPRNLIPNEELVEL